MSTRALQFLKGALEKERIAHAYLFSGGGVAREEALSWFTQALLCQTDKSSRPCGDCLACQKFTHRTHPDFYEVVAETKTIKIEQIRVLSELVRGGAHEGAFLVVWLRQPERLTPEAANRFLKLLEEPPAGVVFILVSDQVAAILPTLRSRVQEVWFPPESREYQPQTLDDLSFDFAERLPQEEEALKEVLESFLLTWTVRCQEAEREEERAKFLKAGETTVQTIRMLSRGGNVRLVKEVFVLELLDLFSRN